MRGRRNYQARDQDAHYWVSKQGTVRDLLKTSNRVEGFVRVRIQSLSRLPGSLTVILLLCLLPLARGQKPTAGVSTPPAAQTVVLPASVPDPIEPFNRAMWAFNQELMSGVIKPTSRLYRFIVVKPVRTGLGNMGKNLTYPDRVINNLLQRNWSGARDESYRFLYNTTVGVAGFWDVATKWKIPKSEADFGQTFGQWGWKPNCYIMLPIFGPSNDRDVLGLGADTAANPLLYISPYEFVANNPLTYLGPYSYFTYAVMYNDFADTVRVELGEPPRWLPSSAHERHPNR